MSKITDGLNEALGREAERAAIVAWLRETAAEYKAKTTAQQAVIEFNDNFSSTCGVAADAIEAGEHLK